VILIPGPDLPVAALVRQEWFARVGDVKALGARHLAAVPQVRLAAVEPGGRPDADALLGQLAPQLPHLSCVVFVMLAWDEPRRALAERIRESGAGCTVLVVTSEESTTLAGAGVKAVSEEAITSGRALSL